MRIDLYDAPHKALRRELMLLTIDVAGTDGDDIARVQRLAARLAALVVLLDEHARHEDSFVLPHLQRAAPAIATELEEAHRALDARFAALVKEANEVDGVERFGKLRSELQALAVDYLVHMQDEETRAMPALWAAHTDEELLRMQNAVRGAIPPPMMAQFLALMIPAFTPNERVMFLSGVRAAAPPPAYQAMFAVAQRSLDEAAARALEARLAAQ